MTTRTDLEEILKANLKGIHFQRSDQTYEGVVNCLVDAYNRGIDDAAESVWLEMVKETDFSIIGGGKQIKRSSYYGPWQKEREGDSEYWVEVEKDSILKLKI